MKLERTKNATRNILFGVVLKVYQILVPFVMRTIMIYFLGVQYLGLNSLFTSILQVLNLAELGVGSAMVYSMYKPIVEDDKDRICSLMRLYRTYYRIIGLVILLAGAILTPFVPHLIKGDIPADMNVYVLYLLNLGATVLSYWLFAYKNSLFQAFQRQDVVSKVTLVTNTIQYVFQAGAIVILHNYYVYVIMTLGGQALTNIVTAITATKMYPDLKPGEKLDDGSVKEINHRIRDLFTAKLGSVIVGSADTIVISAFLGLTALAVYQNYYYILNAVYVFVGIILSSVTAGIGNSLITESLDKNYNDLKIFTFIICWIICVCCACFAGLYQPFMKIWVGDELMLNDDFVPLMCVYYFVLELSMVWATVKDAAGLWHSDRFRPLIGALSNLGMNIILVQFIGLYGIVLSTILSYVFISMPWLIHNIFKLLYKRSPWEYVRELVKYAAVTVICTSITLVISENFSLCGIGGFIILALLCLIIPNIILFAFFHKWKEFSDSKELVLRMIHRR